jgi:hypothetical protein
MQSPLELADAMSQIADIRRTLARTETFRGYRSLTVAWTSLFGFLGAAIQIVWVPAPLETPARYLTVWIGLAAIGQILSGLEIVFRARRSPSSLTQQLCWLAVEQFLPCLFVGAAVTWGIASFAIEQLWLLPGLWSLIFGLGVSASARLLPREVIGVAVWYLVTGSILLAVARGPHACSPWAMVLTFGIGQAAISCILYWRLEKSYDSKTE